jgi:phage tail sheath gpL-like
MGIAPSAVARGTGVTTKYKDLSGGAVRFVPQRIAIIAQGEDGLSYPLDKFTIDGGASQVGGILGYSSQAYQIARELFPVNGTDVGTTIVDVIPLPQPTGGAAAVGGVDVGAGTASETGTYYPTLGGVQGDGVLVPKGAIIANEVLSDVTDSINNKLGMPAKAANTYGAPVGTDSANIALTVISVTGTPKGGTYSVVCSDAGAQLFSLYDPKGNLKGKDLAVGANVVDGLTFTITATVATLGETATIDVPVTDVVLTMAWLGVTGNQVELEMAGPTTFGVTWALTAFSGGGGSSDVDPALALIGEVWNTMIITPERETSSLDKFVIWGEGRWDTLVHKPCVVFYGNNDESVGDATFDTQNRGTDRVTCQLVNPGSNNMPWVIAAAQVNPIVNRAQVNPPYDYGSLPVFTLNAGPDAVQWDYKLRDLAVKQGSSTVEKKDGVVNVSDVVTPWRPTGEEPPAYRYVVDIVKIMQVIHNLNLAFNNPEWDGAPLIPFGPTTNPDAKTPKMAIALVAGIVDNLALAAIISDAERAKKTITANINPSNPKRLDVAVTVQISGNTNIRDVTLNWGFFFGSAPVVG